MSGNLKSEFCLLIFTGKNKLEFHIKTVHRGERDFECKYCGKKYSTNANLKVHEATIHTKDLPFKCDYCAKGFVRKKACKEHMDKCADSQVVQKKEQFVVVANPIMADIIME